MLGKILRKNLDIEEKTGVENGIGKFSVSNEIPEHKMSELLLSKSL